MRSSCKDLVAHVTQRSTVKTQSETENIYFINIFYFFATLAIFAVKLINIKYILNLLI